MECWIEIDGINKSGNDSELKSQVRLDWMDGLHLI